MIGYSTSYSWLHVAALLCFACCVQGTLAQNATSTGAVREVATAAELQSALVDGVPHIVVTAHINADGFTAVRGNLDASIGAVKPTTKSIVVRLCSAVFSAQRS